MADGCGTKLARCVLFFINFLIWVGCFCIIASGIAMLVTSSYFESIFDEDKISSIAALLIFVGSVGFFVGFCGCCGVLTNSPCLLKTYILFMVVVVLGEITGGTVLLVYRDQVETSMVNGMTSAIKNDYGVTEAATDAVDFMQYAFQCCGATYFTDYVGSQYRQGTGLGSLPDTCCSEGVESGTCSLLSGSSLYKQGCVPASIEVIQDSILVVVLVCFAVIALEILTISLACCLIISGRDSANYAYKNFS